MQVYRMVTGGDIAENTYFLIKDNKDTLIFDPGNDAEKILDFLKEKGAHPVAIALTHAHYDHIGAVDALRQAYDIPVYINAIEKDFLRDPNLNLSSRHFPNLVIQKDPDITFDLMGPTDISGFSCRLAHIPGHSPGSTAYIFDDYKLVIAGDTLFAGGCGRCDLPGSSSHQELMAGIEKHLMSLPEDTLVLSGHGPETTIGQEKATNPYLNGVTR